MRGKLKKMRVREEESESFGKFGEHGIFYHHTNHISMITLTENGS